MPEVTPVWKDPPKRKRSKPRPAAEQATYDDAKAQLERRSGGWCEWPNCRRPAADPHHMLPEQHGGTDDLSNLAALCRQHHDAVHAMPVRDAVATGFLRVTPAQARKHCHDDG